MFWDFQLQEVWHDIFIEVKNWAFGSLCALIVPDSWEKDLVNQIISGKNPIKVYREFRKLSLSELAKKTNLSISYLSQLEHNDRKGSANSLKNIASALMIGIDDLL